MLTSDDSDENVVGQFAFRFCAGITRIVIEEGIDAIEDFAFIGCGNVTSIVLPASLKRVGRGAFIGLPHLAYIECRGTTPPTWQRSDVFAYEGTAAGMADDAMKRVLYVPSGYADTYAAAKYSGIGWGDAFARIYEKNSTPQEIGSLADLKAFRDAVNSGELYKESDCKEVTLTADIDMSGESWTPIGTHSKPYDGIFNGNGHVVKNLYVELTTDYAGLFGYAKNATIYNMHLQNPQVRGNDYVGSLAGYTGSGTALTIPDTYNGKDVTAVLDGVFQGNATLSAITMGTKLQTVGRNAFRDCDALTAIDLPDAVTTVGEDAFRHCDNLASFNIGKGFKDHDGNFLAYCPKLTDITCSRGNDNGYLCVDNVLLHNVSGYGSYVVACATGKTGDYVIPTAQLTQSDVFLLRNCFASCTGLTSITFPAGKNYELGGSLFNEASNLKVVDLSEVTRFRNDATYTASRSDSNSPFYGLNERTMVYLPHGHDAEQTEPNILIMNSEGTAATANAVLLAEGWDFLPKVPVTAANGVSYRRSINYVDKNENDDYVPQGLTVCLPYDLTLLSDDATVYDLSAIETVEGETTVTFTEVASKEMTAYTPYYIVMQNDQELDFSTDASITISTPPDREPEAIGTYMFKGTTAEIPNSMLYDADRPAYLLLTDGQWHKVPQNQPKAYVGPFRAYFQATDAHAARALGMVLEHHHHDGSEPSAIVQVRTIGNDGTECYYDLNGRRLAAKPQKGIYVTGGKSYISK